MKTIKKVSFKLPTIDEVDFEIICDPEEIPIRGNCVATGNDEQDKEIENNLIEQLENGNDWAWCMVEVKASYKGIEASDYLGGCSYGDENGFKNDGYYADMKQTAFDNLIESLKNLND